MNLFSWNRAVKDGDQRLLSRHSWAATSVGRSLSRTRLFLKRQLWIWPILAVLLLSLVAVFVRRAIETTMREGLQSELQTLLNVETAMLETWLKSQQSNAESLANSIDIREVVYPLLDTDDEVDNGEMNDHARRAKLNKSLAPALSAHHYAGFLLANQKKQIVAASHPELIGQSNIEAYDSWFSQVLDGITVVSPPFASQVALQDEAGRIETGVPTLIVAAPIRDESFQVVGVLALLLKPQEEFSRILRLGEFGNSGETYAIDREGRMVSNGRFDEKLILLGVLPDEPNAQSILRVLVRDPGGDMTAGFRPTVRRHELPLTHAAAEAIAERPGVDVDGYRDYRGVRSVGAWKWLPSGGIGVITEVDFAEAFRPLMILRWTFWALFALLTLSALAIFIVTVLLARARREAQKAAIAAQQIGQYQLERKLGSGGMGVVYQARHAMLRRPTAIKMLDVDKVNEASIERFEREVQITSQLNNPNTVAIYDYGRTPEGVFYYAMEFLDGIDLQALVDRYGPQPVPRVIHILQQICNSLYEAHCLGLVHRDIKPANIMLNRRGGEPDVIKVLDFGLVKGANDEVQSGVTQQGAMTGTPLYMSPEAIQEPDLVDARSDLYAVGAVGYFLLTGRPVFDGTTIVELCQKHLSEPPAPPSERIHTAIPSPLENALLACLEKSRAKRPQTARELSQLLSRCKESLDWSIEEADAWWGRHERDPSQKDVTLTRGNQTGAAQHDVTMEFQHKS